MSEQEESRERSRIRRNRAVGIVVFVIGWGVIILLALTWLTGDAFASGPDLLAAVPAVGNLSA